MQKTSLKSSHNAKEKIIGFLILCILGIGCNLLGAWIVQSLSLPFYLDTIGTILASALGGFMPGTLAGFLTNLIHSFSDGSSLYYAVINIAIAVLAVQRSFQKGYSTPGKCVVTAFLFSIVGGIGGALLTWGMNGLQLDENSASSLVLWFCGHGFSSFWASLLEAFLMDFADKLISVSISALVLRLVPKRYYYLEKTDLPQNAQKKRFFRVSSVRSKLIVLVATTLIILAACVSFVSYQRFHSSMIEQQSRLAEGVLHVMADSIDADRIPAYLKEGKDAEGYRATERALARLASSSPDIAFTYVYRIEEDGCRVVFDPDTIEVKGLDPGEMIPFDEDFLPYVPDLLAGRSIPVLEVRDQYGWLLSIYQPLRDSNGTLQAYAGVDISMSLLMRSEIVFLTRLLSIFFSILLVVLILFTSFIDRTWLRPINAMANAASQFAYDTEGVRHENVELLRSLDIHSGDEIENLYHALLKTSEDTTRYIQESEEKNEVIHKLQDGLIMVLADLVESRDQCTGNHVRNTAMFAKIIMEQMRDEGLYPDILKEEYTHDVVATAPLHDVGKIHVPDAILNKPGKLTDEEFRQMKYHTVEGNKILTRAIHTISDQESTYLREARNLALYHHEKWNGTGYPNGLKGEEIPLSARIMAVADVFDALIAKRSYKDGFPFEKAMAIIQEGAGTHFDPQVTAAFLHAEQRIRKVASTRNEDE